MQGMPGEGLEPRSMKLVVAIIQPPRLEAVMSALHEAGVERMTVCDAQGYARQQGRGASYRGHQYQVQFLRKVVLEIVVNDDFLERTLDALQLAARSGPDGEIGDGKIFVWPVEQALQISDGKRGPQAV